MATDGDRKGSGGDTGSAGSKKPLPPSARRKKRRVAEAGSGSGQTSTGRYTAPVPESKRGPSPPWVPVLMFGLWVVGLSMILLNYMGVLPGSDSGGNGWYLVGGLGLILGGIVTATQYR
jgi:hypothetical protein